jgi:hypothetical protein
MRVLLAAFLAAAAVAVPAHAVPYAGTIRGGEAVLSLVGQDGRRWQLRMRPRYATTVSTASGQTMVVTLTQCANPRSCTYSHTWQQDLAAADVTDEGDGTRITVRARVGGRDLVVTWQRRDTSTGGAFVVSPYTPGVSESYVYEADADVEWGAVNCDDPHATTFEETRVDGSAYEPFAPGPRPPGSLPRGLLGPRLRCG